MAKDFLNDLTHLLGLQASLTQIDFTAINVSSDRLSSNEERDLVRWLLANGGKWSDDRASYADIAENTYHLWLSNDRVQLHCGFRYKGSNPNSYGFGVYDQFQIQIEKGEPRPELAAA